MFEQIGDQRFREFVFIDYQEGTTVLGPSNQIIGFWIVHETITSAKKINSEIRSCIPAELQDKRRNGRTLFLYILYFME